MNYIKRCFSWNGIAGRKEFIGYYVLPFGLFSFSAILPICIASWFGIPLGMGFKLWALFVVLLTVVISVCAWARRLRHLDWPLWLIILLLIPGTNLVVYVLAIVLGIVNPRTPKPADRPSYLLLNLLIGIGGLLLPIFLVAGMVFLAIYYPSQLEQILPENQKMLLENRRKNRSVAVRAQGNVVVSQENGQAVPVEQFLNQ